MRSLSCIVAILALSSAPAGAEPKSVGGAKEFAPGEVQKQPGKAKKYAPGRQQNKPGHAKKYRALD